MNFLKFLHICICCENYFDYCINDEEENGKAIS